MAKIIRIIVNGVRGIGMADGVYSIYRTNRPCNTPIILDSKQAAEADREALESDWSHIGLDLAHAYEKESVSIHA